MRLLQQDDHGRITHTTGWIDCETVNYAILSHTWGEDQDEITFRDIQDDTGKNKPGWNKIRFCAEQAKRDGLKYFWIDTCCIEKSNLSELAESITSMFRWYERSDKCYVYLTDVTYWSRETGSSERNWKSQLRLSRWFTRGWTLQELLAPSVVEFYSRDAHLLGTKSSLHLTIHEITGIHGEALKSRPLSTFSEKERFRWASRRQTKKPEDRMYSLLGIFEVTMIVNYGEGEDNARRRLNKKINERQLDKLNSLSDVEDDRDDSNSELSAGGDQPAINITGDDLGPQSQKLAREAILASFTARTKEERQKEIREAIIQSLRYDTMDTRRVAIKPAQEKTCSWLLNHASYLSWRDHKQLTQHYGFLWIKGKPGAGKSTIMKFADMQTTISKGEKDVSISFYFNARGKEIDHSIEGLYRTLLVQLFERAPEVRKALDHDASHLLSADDLELSFQLEERLERMKATLHAAVVLLETRRLYCFIDALDECPEEDVQDLVLFFEAVGRYAVEHEQQVFICFASRHYPTISINFGVELVLEHEPGHQDDLKKYVRKHLRAGKNTGAVELQILTKAKGIFMWVVLVVGILNDEFRRGRLFAVEQRLRRIPEQISDLFKEIVNRDSTNIEDFRLALSWILFAKRPLTLREFYSAMVAGLKDDDDDDTGDAVVDLDQISDEDIVRFVNSSSKGLAEAVRSGTPQSFDVEPDVPLDEEGGEADKSLLQDGVEAEGSKDKHAIIDGLCEALEALSDAAATLAKTTWHEERFTVIDGLSKSKKALLKVFPEAGEWSNRPNNLQVAHTALFDATKKLRALEQLDDSVGGPEEDMQTAKKTLSEALVEARRSNERTIQFIHETVRDFLLKDDGLIQLYHEGSRQKVDSLCHDALKMCCHKTLISKMENAELVIMGKLFDRMPFLHYAVTYILDHTNSAAQCIVQDDFVLNQFNRQRWIQLTHASGNQAFSDKDTIQYICAHNNFSNILSSLCSSGVDMSPQGGAYVYPFFAAIANSSREALRALLGTDGYANSNDILHAFPFGSNQPKLHPRLSRTPLIWATATARDEETAMALLASTAKLDAMRDPSRGRDALSLAAGRNFAQLCRAIIQRSRLLIYGRDYESWTPLMHAASNGSIDAAEVLLNAGAVVDTQDLLGNTALHLATRAHHIDTMNLLLDRRAIIDMLNRNGEPCLWEAVKQYNHLALEMLLDRGADIYYANKEGQTALWNAVRYNNSTSVRLLLRHGADAKVRDNNGRTAIWGCMEAASPNHWQHWGTETRQLLLQSAEDEAVSLLSMLVSAGADLEVRDNHDQTVLLDAVERPVSDAMMTVLRSLLRVGADGNVMDIDGNTALIKASRENKEQVVEALLKQDVDRVWKNNAGDSALDIATSNGFERIAELLQSNNEPG